MNPKLKTAFSKFFAIAGTVLISAPVLFMFVTAIAGSIINKKLLFDYLTLAELFPLVAIGMGLLILASLFSHIYAKWFCWGSGAALAALAAGQILAVVSGLASGALSMHGVVFVVVIVSIAVFDLIVICLAILGILLIKRLFHKPDDNPADSAEPTDA